MTGAISLQCIGCKRSVDVELRCHTFECPHCQQQYKISQMVYQTPDKVNLHVFPRGKKWSLRRTGAKRALKLYATRRAAWSRAQRMARAERCVAYLHDKAGRIIKRVPIL